MDQGEPWLTTGTSSSGWVSTSVSTPILHNSALAARPRLMARAAPHHYSPMPNSAEVCEPFAVLPLLLCTSAPGATFAALASLQPRSTRQLVREQLPVLGFLSRSCCCIERGMMS